MLNQPFNPANHSASITIIQPITNQPTQQPIINKQNQQWQQPLQHSNNQPTGMHKCNSFKDFYNGNNIRKNFIFDLATHSRLTGLKLPHAIESKNQWTLTLNGHEIWFQDNAFWENSARKTNILWGKCVHRVGVTPTSRSVDLWYSPKTILDWMISRTRVV